MVTLNMSIDSLDQAEQLIKLLCLAGGADITGVPKPKSRVSVVTASVNKLQKNLDILRELDPAKLTEENEYEFDILRFIPKFSTDAKTLKQLFAELKLFDHAKQPTIMLQALINIDPYYSKFRGKFTEPESIIIALMLTLNNIKTQAPEIMWNVDIACRWLVAANRLLGISIPKNAADFFGQKTVEVSELTKTICTLATVLRPDFANVVEFYVETALTLTSREINDNELNALLCIALALPSFTKFFMPFQYIVARNDRLFNRSHLGLLTLNSHNLNLDPLGDDYHSIVNDQAIMQLDYIRSLDIAEFDVDGLLSMCTKNRTARIFKQNAMSLSKAIKHIQNFESVPDKFYLKLDKVAAAITQSNVCSAFVLKERDTVRDVFDGYIDYYNVIANTSDVSWIEDHLKVLREEFSLGSAYDENINLLNQAAENKAFQNVAKYAQTISDIEATFCEKVTQITSAATSLMSKLTGLVKDLPKTDAEVIAELSLELDQTKSELQTLREIKTNTAEIKSKDAHDLELELLAKIEELEAKISDQANTIFDYQSQVELLKDRTIKHETKPDYLLRCLTDQASLLDVVDTVAYMFPEVRFLDFRKELAVNDYKHSHKLLKALIGLCDNYLNAILSGEPDSKARQYLGNAYSANESESTMQDSKLSKLREFKIDDAVEKVEQHLTLGVQRGSQETLQVHFKIINGVLWVARIGAHLPVKSPN